MQKLIYLGVLMLLFSSTLQAQDENKKPLFLYHTSVQFQQLDFTGFNQQLEDLNLLTLPNNTIEINAGVTRTYRRFTTEMAFVFGTATSEVEDVSGPSSRFRYGGIHLSEAFNILNPESGWFFGPEVAINLTYQQILVTGRNNSRNFVDAANNAVYNFERFSETLEGGLRIHKVFQYKDLFEQSRTILIGLHGGYRIEARDNDVWRLNQAIRQNNLGIETGGWFGTITFGITLY